MTGKDIIKSILDQGFVDEEIKIIGVKDDGVSIDDENSYDIDEIAIYEMSDGAEQPALCISNSIVD